jgi:hypothetical protein
MSKILLTSLFLSLCSCASKFFVPGNRFLSSESSGKFLHGDVKSGGIGVTSVQMADDITLASPDLTPKLEKNSAGLFALQLGLFSGLDIYANMPFGGPLFTGGKIQLTGDTFREAKAGNFSLSIAGGAATGTLSQSAEADDIKSESKIKFQGYEAMVIAGLRVTDWTLFYVSPFYTHVSAKAKLQQTDTTNPAATPTVTAEPDGEGDMRGATVGLRFGKYFFVSGEASFTEMTWKRKNPTPLEADKFKNVAIGAALGGAW